MGQCAVSVPPPSYRHGDDSSVETEGSLCAPYQAEAHSYLVPHRHDLPIRCILDPSHVYELILYQADVMSRHAESITSASTNDDSAGGRSDDYAMSTIAPSAFTEGGRTDVTNFSVATRLVSNLDRYSRAKPKFSRPQNPAVVRNKLPKQTDMKSINESDSFDSINSATKGTTKQQPDSCCQSYRSGPIHSTNCPSKPQHDCSGNLPNTKLVMTSLFGPCIGESVARASFSKEGFYNVLHLKMHLNFAPFYRNHYLPRFPKSPTPVGMQHVTAPSRWKKRPSLGATSSDSSSSSPPPVAFGSGIPSSSVKLLADDSAFMDLGVTGSLGLVHRSRAGQARSPKSPRHYIVLINQRSGVPLAVCALRSHNGPPVVRIYATKQRVVGQRPAASTTSLGLSWSDSFPLFAWAELCTQGEFPMPVRYAMYMASGSDGRFEKESSYRASHPTQGSPDIIMTGRTQTESEYSGCAVFSVVSEQEEEPYLCVSIARGIDPALMICFAAIVDETIEKTMRLHCDLSTKKEQRRSRHRSH